MLLFNRAIFLFILSCAAFVHGEIPLSQITAAISNSGRVRVRYAGSVIRKEASGVLVVKGNNSGILENDFLAVFLLDIRTIPAETILRQLSELPNVYKIGDCIVVKTNGIDEIHCEPADPIPSPPGVQLVVYGLSLLQKYKKADAPREVVSTPVFKYRGIIRLSGGSIAADGDNTMLKSGDRVSIAKIPRSETNIENQNKLIAAAVHSGASITGFSGPYTVYLLPDNELTEDKSSVYIAFTLAKITKPAGNIKTPVADTVKPGGTVFKDNPLYENNMLRNNQAICYYSISRYTFLVSERDKEIILDKNYRAGHIREAANIGITMRDYTTYHSYKKQRVLFGSLAGVVGYTSLMFVITGYEPYMLTGAILGSTAITSMICAIVMRNKVKFTRRYHMLPSRK